MLFDLDQLVKINIINPPELHKSYLGKELHFLRLGSFSDNNYDALITFRDDLKMDPEYQKVVEPPVGYDGNGVFWFDPNHEMARINFEDFDTTTTELKVSTRFNSHFLYILILYIISYKIIRSGGAFCHASAISFKGKNIIFPAWRHTGKTNLMLDLLQDGGQMIADDGVVFFGDGKFIPFTKRMQILYFNLLTYPYLREQIDTNLQVLFEFVNQANNGCYSINDKIIQKFQKIIRAKIDASIVSNVEYSPVYHQCDAVIHLDKNMNVSSKICQLDDIDLRSLVNKVSESSLFETSHFITAYNVYKLTQDGSRQFLDNARDKISKIFSNGFSKINKLYELKLDQSYNENRAKLLVVRCINEK